MKNVIYKIRNVVNDHYYIGSTVDSRKRFWAHRKDLRLDQHVCIHLQRAWNKYGEDCFKFEIVEQLDSREALFPAEQRWLDDHFGKEYCYNVAAYADAPMRDASPELRAHLAEKTKAWLERDGHPRQGAEWTEEKRKEISESRMGKHAGAEHYRYGKQVSSEVRAKIGATQKGKPKAAGRKVSPEGRAKIRANIEAGRSHKHWLGRQHTEEAKAKMSKTVFVKPDGVMFPSLTLVLKYYDIKMPTLNRALKSGKPLTKGKLAGYEFSYGGIYSEPSENDLALIRARLDSPQTT
jgi:group I intron endonuclease